MSSLNSVPARTPSPRRFLVTAPLIGVESFRRIYVARLPGPIPVPIPPGGDGTGTR